MLKWGKTITIWWVPLKQLVTLTGAATNPSIESEHKTKLKIKLTTNPVFETLYKKIKILYNVQNTG
jgi:hypothetical protein